MNYVAFQHKTKLFSCTFNTINDLVPEFSLVLPKAFQHIHCTPGTPDIAPPLLPLCFYLYCSLYVKTSLLINKPFVLQVHTRCPFLSEVYTVFSKLMPSLTPLISWSSFFQSLSCSIFVLALLSCPPRPIIYISLGKGRDSYLLIFTSPEEWISFLPCKVFLQ